jgi:hypothetical protein
MASQSSARAMRNLTRVCSVPDCGKRMSRRGYCDNHWEVWSKLDEDAKAAAAAGLPIERKPYEYLGDEETLARECARKENTNARPKLANG